MATGTILRRSRRKCFIHQYLNSSILNSGRAVATTSPRSSKHDNVSDGISLYKVEPFKPSDLRQYVQRSGVRWLSQSVTAVKQPKPETESEGNHQASMSGAFAVSGNLKPEEAGQATISSLPDEDVDAVQVTSLPYEDSVLERRRKLEFPEMQEELIKEEEEREEVEQARMEINFSQDDKALREVQDESVSRASDKSTIRCRSEEEVRAMFEEWILKTERVYSGLEEKEMRFQIFKNVLREIDEIKAQEPLSPVGLNNFADKTEEEIHGYRGASAYGYWFQRKKKRENKRKN